MLHILLLILKIIGITLLAIIGLILLIILLILFVPVRYRGEGRCKQNKTMENADEDTGDDAEETKKFDLYAMGKITWLLHFVSLKFEYSDGIRYRLKILGIPFMKSDSDKETASGDDVKSKKKNKKQKKDGSDDPDQETADTEDKEDSDIKEIIDCSDTTENTENTENTVNTENTENASSEDKNENNITDENSEQNEISNNPGLEEPDDKKKTDTEADKKKEKKNKKDKDKKTKDKKKKNKKKDEDAEGSEEKQSVVEKIKNIYNKVTALLNDRKVKRAYELVKVQLLRLIKAVVPRKTGGYARYGFENPAVTGYITAFLAAEYGRFRKLDIEPHFEDEILEGELTFRGRIFMITMLCIGLKVYFSKDVKYTVKKLKEFKEDSPETTENNTEA